MSGTEVTLCLRGSDITESAANQLTAQTVSVLLYSHHSLILMRKHLIKFI